MLKSPLSDSHFMSGLEEEQPIFGRSPALRGDGGGFAFDVLNFKDSIWNNACALQLRKNMEPQPVFLLFERVAHLQPPLTIRKSRQNFAEPRQEQIRPCVAAQ